MEVNEFDEQDFLRSISGETPEKPEEKTEKEEFILEKSSDIENDKFLTNENLSELTGESVEDIKSQVEENPIQNTDAVDKDSFYKARIEFAKSIGRLPDDFELEDDVVLDDESYTKIIDYENQYVYDVIASQVREEYTTKLGDNIVRFVEAGGDVTKIAELVKEQNKIVEFNVSTDSGQKAIVSKYHKEVLKWSDQRIEKYVDRLYNDGDLEEEAVNLKTEFDSHFQEQQNQLVEQQIKEQKKQAALQQKQIDTFSSVLLEEGFTQKDITQYVDYVYKEIPVNENLNMPALDLKIMQIQRNPKELLELIQFVNDKDKFLKRKAIELNNPKVDKTFTTILKNKTAMKGGTTSSPLTKTKEVGAFYMNI